MEKVALKVVAASALLAFVGTSGVLAADATVGADVKSAYVFRGVTLNEGFVAQPYLDVSGLPIDIGVWGNWDIEEDDLRGYDDTQFSEIDIYGSYTLPIEAVDVAIGYTEYTYPTGDVDADREVSLSLAPGSGTCPANPSLGLYYGIDGAIEENFYAEAAVGHDIALTEELTLGLGALIGYLYPDQGENGFNQYELSANLAYSFLTAGVAYIGQVDDDVLVDATEESPFGHDVDFVFTVGASHSF